MNVTATDIRSDFEESLAGYFEAELGSLRNAPGFGRIDPEITVEVLLDLPMPEVLPHGRRSRPAGLAGAVRGAGKVVRRALIGGVPRHLNVSSHRLAVRRASAFAIQLLSRFLLGAMLALIVGSIAGTVMRGFTVPSESMTPTLKVGEYLLVNVPAAADLRHGDVVVFRDLEHWGAGEYVVKRVIGLPGDTVEVDSRGLVVNGFIVDEPYLEGPVGDTFAEVLVPAGEVWVMGDNRAASADSRIHGTVATSAVVGVVFASVGDGVRWLDDREALRDIPPLPAP